ncbi:MAG: SDR family oxidoreductase [Verrucomicrobiales bacterium]|nr:SDR family oxidoreductase [Verrucomicrobiales bacterium]
MSQRRRPEAPVALITGAAGGLGSALIREFDARGHRVVAAWHSHPPASVPEGGRALRMDVGDGEAVDAGFASVAAVEGRLDVLVNNAGLTADAALWQVEDAIWEQVMQVNLGGAFRCSRSAARSMSPPDGGHIINISSLSGCVGARGQTHYAAAKAGLLGLTQSLAAELGPRNIRVNAVLPGFLETPMTAGLPAAERERFRCRNVLGRTGSVAEVARFVVFLAGMQDVSGQVFALDSRLRRWGG